VVQFEYVLQRIDELDMRDGSEGTRPIWRFDQSQLFPGDKVRIYVGQQVSRFDLLLLFVVNRLFSVTKQREGRELR
jgi:hypothetical protein